MSPGTVLVITHEADLTADLVVHALQNHNVQVARFDLTDFPQRLTLTGSPDHQGSWCGRLHGEHWSIDLQTVRAIWYRKPSPFRPAAGLSPTDTQWATAEARAGLGGILATLPALWINRPDRTAAADYKPWQLTIASRCGLIVPPTVITNDVDRASEFCHRHDEVIYKPLTGGPGCDSEHRVSLHAQTVTAEQITEGVRGTAHLFQARVPCAYAVRLTVVGPHLFAARIDTPPNSDLVDWRAVHDLRYTPIPVPSHVATGVIRMMDQLGLVFAAPDFVVDPHGEWHFIGDLNPNGQWAWIPQLRAPITTALADLLSKGP